MVPAGTAKRSPSSVENSTDRGVGPAGVNGPCRMASMASHGICNSACTLVLGIVPLNRICATPRASLGFHQAYYDKR